MRYREERAQARACESDPAWDYVMALLYEVGHVPPVLPTHRVLLAGPAGDALLAALGELVTQRAAGRPCGGAGGDGPDGATQRGRCHGHGTVRAGEW